MLIVFSFMYSFIYVLQIIVYVCDYSFVPCLFCVSIYSFIYLSIYIYLMFIYFI